MIIQEEGKAETTEEPGAEGTKEENLTEKPTTPSKEKEKEKEARRGLLNAIRLPLVSVFPKKKKVSALRI